MKIKTVIDKTEKFIETHEQQITNALCTTAGVAIACAGIGLSLFIALKQREALIQEGEAAKFFLRQMLEPIVENATPIS